LVGAALAWIGGCDGQARQTPVQETVRDPGDVAVETATFGAGCFWGVEAAFRRVDGVVNATVGYTGGTVVNPTYQQVCTDATGHAEVVRVEFDPSRVSYEDLLEVFWGCHDPTTVNRQGPDVGTQYRSAVFYHTPAQRDVAIASRDKRQASGTVSGKIATQIVPAGEFYPAEEYHQRYLQKRGLGQCRTR